MNMALYNLPLKLILYNELIFGMKLNTWIEAVSIYPWLISAYLLFYLPYWISLPLLFTITGPCALNKSKKKIREIGKINEIVFRLVWMDLVDLWYLRQTVRYAFTESIPGVLLTTLKIRDQFTLSKSVNVSKKQWQKTQRISLALEVKEPSRADSSLTNLPEDRLELWWNFY